MKSAVIISFFLLNFSMAQNLQLAYSLYHSYENYKENSLTVRRFKYNDFSKLIEKLKQQKLFAVQTIGTSVEGREIYLIKLGTGSKKIFLWSQMHGNEATATMALFDIFNFFLSSDDFNKLKEHLLSNLQIYIIPMLNPDGAEKFTRRNSLEIDINRDAISLQSPESILLKNTFEKIKPEFGFNLHDQNSYYSAGNNFESALISFLAPAENFENTDDLTRIKSKKLIGFLFKTLNEFIPGHIGKYSDEFEPRAFGDNFQMWGMSTVLIESGGWKDDPERQFARKMNFISLLTAFRSIADNSFEKIPTEVYESIPFNKQILFDLILRNVFVTINGLKIKLDIAINREEVNYNNDKEYYYKSNVEDIGDLSTYFGYEEIDLTDCQLLPGKLYNKKTLKAKDLNDSLFNKIYKEGFTTVKMNNFNDKIGFAPYPVNILSSKKQKGVEFLKLNEPANFIIIQNNKLKYIVINGFIRDIENNIGEIPNGLVF